MPITTAPVRSQVKFPDGSTVQNPQPVVDTAVVVPLVVTGAKGSNVALASLLAALVNLGLIIDQTTA